MNNYYIIQFRDDSGRRYEIEGERAQVYAALTAKPSAYENDEIMLVVCDGMCLYSGLMPSEGLELEELIGFLA